ncbi:hypothetical protein AVEN_239857-1 [Araneus ventricosus]|uniref:Uncharacterized protein n=1 Tax=Araneus ventricosus TaxID=182803 RepID=A0A4Y2F8Z4_ARAVE|nr:hypothetical protein AVEN_239857-1 [Araneus ventricosus]
MSPVLWLRFQLALFKVWSADDHFWNELADVHFSNELPAAGRQAVAPSETQASASYFWKSSSRGLQSTPINLSLARHLPQVIDTP